MDPNFVGSRYEFDDEGNLVQVRESNEWDLGEHYANLATDPAFYLSDVESLGFFPNTIFNPEPYVSSSDDAAAAATAAAAMDPSPEEDTDFSENFKFISQILMEENFDQKPCMCYDPVSLQHTEKSFFDALELESSLPLSPNQHPLESPDGNSCNSTSDSASSQELKPLSPDTPVSGSGADAIALDSSSRAPSLLVPPHALTMTNINDGILDSDFSVTRLLAENIFSDAESMVQFRRGLEEASKFLPQRPQLLTGLESTSVSAEAKGGGVAVRMNHSRGGGVKSRKNHARQDEEEGRSNKQCAVCVEEESEISDMFDRVLLSVENEPLNGAVGDSSTKRIGKVKLFDGGKVGSKKQGKKKETVDLRTLLVVCAQAASASDNRTAKELLKQIRHHSSPLGDASQRLAHYVANALEARLVGSGTGTQIFYMSYKNFTAAHYLKAYQVFMSACPFKKFAHFFANKMILKTAEKAESLHIIDFGILYGFQWPILIKFLSSRSGGPAKLRITGIEYPQAGFRPAEGIEETGRRLAKYCERFNVPFEYKAIASRNWETIQIEDLNIKSNEVLAVNCMVRFKNLLDESIEVSSPRNAVLNLIRKMNPDIFVHTVMNGSYNAPFFVTRFREALFHYSSIYDMFDTLISRENEWRLMLEREFLGREIMNVVACEALERVERPETYKQWQARNTRAGFKQLPLDKEIMAKFRGKLREWYHKDFVFDEDSNWMLQGWKGRIFYASSCWVPAAQ
ncbi:Scarecrow-like protein 14, partial [Mucuna pruriens]